MSEPVQFSGFGKDSLKFLKALGFHQNREWFHENKLIYESEIKGPMGDLVEDLTLRLAAKKVPLKGDRKNSLYRVNRDVRFSKNKDPYVTHASAMLTRSGSKKDNGFLYMHYSNERSFIASGFYGLEGEELRAFRELICREPDVMIRLVTGMEKHGYQMETEGAMKRNPRGFEDVTDPQLQGWVRLKNHVFMENLPPEIFQSPELAVRMVKLAERSMPFLDFGWRAIGSVRDEPQA
ncbi:MAG: TIGR02453 family protein [Nitratireductor sp.]